MNAGQLSIESMLDLSPAEVGRHEQALQLALGATSHLGDDPRTAAAVSLATALARGLDVAERRGDTATATQSAKSYTDVLDRLGLLPPASAKPAAASEGEGGEHGSGDLMGRFGGAEVVHPAVA